jgi:hypothetical protein
MVYIIPNLHQYIKKIRPTEVRRITKQKGGLLYHSLE